MFGDHRTGPGWLAGGGEMGTRMRAVDWSTTPLGSLTEWPQGVRTAVSICLNSRFPILLWIGRDLRLIYNDAYIPFLGETKHPAALGAAGRMVWGEIWATIGPMHEEVAAGRATSVEDLQMFFARELPREEVFVTFGFSPILAADGVTIEGVFCACSETTTKVIGERRLATLRDLGARSAKLRTAEVACRHAAEVLQGNPLDIPFAAVYLLDEERAAAHRVAATRLENDSIIFPERLPVGGDAGGPWPLSRVAESRQPCDISDLSGTVGILPAGAWPDAVETAIVLPLAAPIQPRPAGFLIVGVSPRRVLDADYRSFFDLVARHIATNIADARSFEAERKRAEGLAELDRAKTIFFSNVSHEFRTPLTLMMSPIEEILAERSFALTYGHRALLDVAHRNALRLLRLVNSLLDFSKLEAGRIQASYEPLDLAALTADLASNFRSACERAGLALDVHCPSLAQPVYVDREMWEKIVLNLVSNAIKFTLEGRIEVAVHADGARAALVVRDSGVGISEAELPRVFERFHRVAGQRARTHEGTGIGLALVRGLVRAHGGEIRVDSEISRGTTFTVTIPFGRDHLPADRISAARPPAPTAIGAGAFVEEALRWLPAGPATDPSDIIIDDLASRPDDGPAERRRSRVLIVDDNADMRDHLCRLLAKWWDVEAAGDGLAALDAVRRRPPDLVLADIMMPRLDGFGLLARLRSDPDLADIPVILLSARAGEEARIEGLNVGADDYLTKPFSVHELIARVRAHLSLSRLRSEHVAALTRLHELSVRLIATSDLTSFLNEVLDATIELQGADFGTVQLYDEASGILRIVAHRGLDQRFLDHFTTVDATGTSVYGRGLRSGARVIVDDVDTDPDWEPHREIAASAGFGSVQWAPLLDRNTGQPIGMISTYFRKPRRPSRRELRLTDFYARQTASALSSLLAEQRLRESEARLQAAVDLVKLGRYAWNPQTDELQWDDVMRAMWGLPAGAPVDYAVWRAGVHPDDLERVEAAIGRCADPQGDGLYDIEYRVVGEDGVERWVATRGRTHFRNGRPISFHGVALDITAQKHIEHTLEQRVQSRTSELEQLNRQLLSQIEQRQQAEAAVEQLQRLDAIGQTTSGIAHDFNNLLTIILTNARLLLRGRVYDQEGLDLIHSAAERGAKLITQLLAFSRKQRLEPQAVDLAEKIAGMSDLLRATLEGTVHLTIRTVPDLRPALVDPTQIELLVLNLAINGRDAMSGGGKLIVETFNSVVEDEPSRPGDPSPGRYVAIAVTDAGTGVPDDVLPHVFEPFFSTKGPGRGSGLGLAQVFGIAKQSGGGVYIDTRLGYGTTVKVLFPLAGVDIADEEGEADQEVSHPARRASILVVDDDNAVLSSAIRMLNALGYTAIPAQSGAEALRLIATKAEIALVLADFAMPVMNGVELAKAIGRAWPSMPVILVTGNGEVDALSEVEEVQLLHKPYSESDLVARIETAMNAPGS